MMLPFKSKILILITLPLIVLVLGACRAQSNQPAVDNQAAQVEASATESTLELSYYGPAEMGGSDTSKCPTLQLDAPTEVVIGACDGTTRRQVAGERISAEWLHFRDRFAPFIHETATEKLVFEGKGSESSEPGRRAILAWARARYGELISGKASATINTAMSWHLGQDNSQKNICMHLTVLDYGYAQAEEILCEGQDTVSTTGDWLTNEELTQLDSWLYQRAHLYVDNNYIAGKGTQTISEAEIAAIDSWAANLWNRIRGEGVSITADSSSSTCPDSQEGLGMVRDYRHGFCLLVPGEYTVFDTNSDESLPYETVLAQDSLLNVAEPRVQITVSTAEGRTLEQAIDEIIAVMESSEIKRSAATVSGQQAIVLDNIPGQDISRRVLVVHNDRLYDLTFTPIDHAEMERFYSVIMAHFTLIDIESTSVSSEPLPVPDAANVIATDVQYIVTLTNVNIRSGPGTNYEIVGTVFEGQRALVTGIMTDGSWWRVICPDDSVGNCFVVNDPVLTQPATAP